MHLSLVLSWQGFASFSPNFSVYDAKEPYSNPWRVLFTQRGFTLLCYPFFMRHYDRLTPSMCRIYSIKESSINGEYLPVLSHQCLILTSTTNCSLRHSHTFANDEHAQRQIVVPSVLPLIHLSSRYVYLWERKERKEFAPAWTEKFE